MDYTTNYQLPVWAETDRILRTDFNDAYEKIDSALSNFAANHNCYIYDANFTGDGSTSQTFYFTHTPMLVIAMGPTHWLCGIYGCTSAFAGSFTGSSQRLNVSWTVGTMTVSGVSDPAFVCNTAGVRYRLMAMTLVD